MKNGSGLGIASERQRNQLGGCSNHADRGDLGQEAAVETGKLVDGRQSPRITVSADEGREKS